MGIKTSQSFLFKLVANDIELDLFGDEDITVSDNVTGLFDIGVLPSDFTRQITLPGTKKNNAFFEHYYDISVQNPILFTTNTKVSCYIDMGGIYLAQGYIQLDKVNVLYNKFIDSYEVSVYGSLSSFSREISRNFLTDLTSSLAKYDHTASLSNITASWSGNLFNGDIVYPMAEYGQKILFLDGEGTSGISNPSGSLFVQDYKPAIRIKKVWDAIFEEYGYSYSSTFWEQPFLDQIYMICNNQLRYPIFDEVNLETYGQIRIAPVSGSTDTPLLINQPLPFPWYTIQSNPANNISEDLIYTLDYPSKLRGILNLECKVEKQSTGNGVPQFDLVILDASDVVVATISLTTFNDFFSDIRDGYISQNLNTETTKYTLQTEFNTTYLPADTYRFAIKYRELGGSNFTVKIDPDNSLKSYLQITKTGNVGEGLVMKIGQNMPFGTRGIKQLDFITAIQKKFNLVIYPSKTQRNQFIVETFNNWARIGKVKSFDGYMNLNQNIEVIPANNLAVNELNFGDTLDRDYISQQFNNLANREYGKTYYVDTENFFSQGTFTVSTTLASAPLSYLEGTGVSGSQDFASDYLVSVDDVFVRTTPSSCPFAPQIDSEIYKIVVSVTNLAGITTTNFGPPITVNVRFTYTGPSFGQDFTIPISVPFGSSIGEYTYTQSAWNNFFGSECSQETQIPQCVVSVQNATLSVISPLTLC
jgi:small nuclear ribonucleoprotein (snRNP)-like protein